MNRDASASCHSVGMPDADIVFHRDCPLPAPPDQLLRRLIDETPWRQEQITLWGKTWPQPRLIAWYGDPDSRYRYSGTALQPQPWTGLLGQIRRVIEAESGESFNSVLLNYYRDGRDSMGMHADDEPELGPQPCIASLSLGETRVMVFRHRHRRELKTVRIPLPAGSLLVMRGTTQSHWKHGINKSRRAMGPRVNLTFRQIVATRQE